MLTIELEPKEFYDDSKREFVKIEPITLEFEHSLVSLSKWESIHKKPFLTKEDKTREETFSYIECMLLTPNVSTETIQMLGNDKIRQITEYINDSQTATWFRETREPPSREIITSELIYYWMVAMQIPFECQHWHINRLITLIKVINQKNAPAKKMSKSEMAAQRRKLNAQRRAQYNTTG